MREVMKQIMFSHYNFKCDCKACTDERHSSLWNVSTEVNINIDGLMKVNLLKEGWNIINNENNTLTKVYKYKIQNMLIMQSLAYDMTFPY